MTTQAQRTRLKIQKKSVFGKDIRLEGYPTLKFMGSRIAEYIPKCKLYVEPFAGLGNVAKHVKADRFVLNDKSPFAYNFLKSHFTAEITNLDFEEFIKLYDSEDTFFLIDPPWITKIYQNNPLPYCDRTALEYYQKVFELIPNLKGDWILCSDKAEHDIRKICSKSGYPTLKLESNRTLFGKKFGVLLTSNKQFVRHQQAQLTTQGLGTP